jgi:hypothetical protein
MVDDFYPGRFFIVKHSIILAAENENIYPGLFKISGVADLQFLTVR